jgi:hypothetical protein
MKMDTQCSICKTEFSENFLYCPNCGNEQKRQSMADIERKAKLYDIKYGLVQQEKISNIRFIITHPSKNIFTIFLLGIGISICLWVLLNNKNSTDSLLNDEKNSVNNIELKNEQNETKSKFSGNRLKTGDSPYDSYFGKGFYDQKYQNKLEIINNSEQEVIVCLTEYHDKKRTIRNEYVRAEEIFTMTSIPNGTYFLKCFFGKDWNPDTLLFDGKLRGFFDSNQNFTASDQIKDLIKMNQGENSFTTYTITLKPIIGGNMESREINLETYFK